MRRGEARFDQLRRTPEPHHANADVRRLTRLTNAFSKKFENHMHLVALYTIWYNYVKQHKSLKGLSPAMAAGISDDANLPKPGKRGPYKKQAA